MKILMILESGFPPDKRVEKEIAALSDAGHQVDLACSTRIKNLESGQWEKSFIYRKFMSTFIYKSSVGCLKFPFYFRFWKDHITTILNNCRYDAVHIHDLPLISIGTELKRKFNINLVIDLHENYPALLKDSTHTQTVLGRLLSSNKQWIAYEKRYLPKADLIITVVEEAKNRIKNLGIDENKICIVSNAFDIENDQISKVNKTGDGFTVFYGGAINRHRGLQVVLEAIKLLYNRNIRVKLLIVGSGSYKKNLKNKAVSLGIKSQIIFYGYKPWNEMLDLLSKADVGIIPHLHTDNNDASSPNKLYQYMYLEKAVIASDCLSLKRIISETDCGFNYQSDSPEELALLIENLQNNKHILEEKGKNGKAAVISKYNWNNDKKRLAEAYICLAEINKS